MDLRRKDGLDGLAERRAPGIGTRPRNSSRPRTAMRETAERAPQYLPLEIRPVKWREAKAFVEQYHRHLPHITGWLFGCSVWCGERMVGCVVVGRPVARHLDDGQTAEIVRCVVLDGCKNAASMLYARARRAAFALGYRRVITYTREDEPGTSLRAAGFDAAADCKVQVWNRPSRNRARQLPVIGKKRWEARCSHA